MSGRIKNTTTPTLPIIDFSHLHEQTQEWESVKKQVLKALEECGCFEAVFDGVPIDLRKATIHAMKPIFDLPLETKLRNKSIIPYHGYIGQLPSFPLYESLGIENALFPGQIQSFTTLIWPDHGNPVFNKSVESFSSQLSNLDKIVRKIILESLGLKKYTNEHMNSTNYIVRVQKYNAPKTSDQTETGLRAHTDKNFVTILHGNEVKGLQVLTKDDKWIDAEPSLNSFIVMVGDSFHAWTNGRVRSSYHRVIMGAGEEARYSIGLFSTPKSGQIIMAPEEMVDEDHPLLYKPIDYTKFLDFYNSQADHLDSMAALKSYCGA